VLGIIVLLSSAFAGRSFSGNATTSSALGTNQKPSASASQPDSTATPSPERTPSTTQPGVPTMAPTDGGATGTPGTSPGSPLDQGNRSSPDVGSSLGALISSAGFGALLLLLSLCGFALAWALRRRW
jgi:hypothetical protein